MSTPDYVKIAEETKQTLLDYAAQEWTVIKTSVSPCITSRG